MSGPTSSEKLNRLIERAEAAGLVVAVESGRVDDIIESWTVRIRRPELGNTNALASYYNAQFLSIYALRIRGRAAAFRLSATQYGLTEPTKIKPKILPYAIDSYGEDYRRYQENYS